MRALVGFSILVLLAVVVPGFVTADDHSSLDQVRAKFAERYPQIDPANIQPGPFDGMLQIRQGTLVAYLTDDGRYLFQGELIDLVADVNLTEQAASESRKTLMNTLDKTSAVVFSPAKPKHSVTIFTDVECTFCRKMHREMDQYLAAGIEIRYLMYPRGGPSSPAWAVAEEVLCSTDRGAAITLAKNDEPVRAEKCAASAAVAEHYQLGQDIGLRGTPAIVLDDGDLVSGYLPASELSKRLELVAKTSN